MEPISNMMIDRTKNAFTTPESTRRTIEEGKDPKKVNEDNSQIINNPAESLIVSESRVTKGTVVTELNRKDDLSLKNLAEADAEGKTTTVPTQDFLAEDAKQPPKIEA